MRDWTVATLISIHGLLSFLADVHGFFNPSRKSFWLAVDHRRLGPINHVTFLSCMVGECVFPSCQELEEIGLVQ